SAVSGIARTNLARVSTTGSGALDTNWTATASGVVQRMALDGTNLFIAGRFLSPRPSLAKLSTGSGTMDANWSPSVALVITGNFTGLAVSGTNLYAANDN